jgi:hypothetical protein
MGRKFLFEIADPIISAKSRNDPYLVRLTYKEGYFLK